MPPLAPPKGMSITAVFHVISDARLFGGVEWFESVVGQQYNIKMYRH